MANFKHFRKHALSFPETIEAPHFEKISFRVSKKIFATLDLKNNQASLKLSESDQYIFSKAGNGSIYPVPNKWGKQGWTVVELEKVPVKLLEDALIAAYCEVAPEKLGTLVDNRKNPGLP